MKLFKINETSFDNFDSTVRNYLSKTLGAVGKQFSNSQIFGAIFEGIKGVMQNAMFYIEDALTEQNIFTAYRKSSIYSLAKVSGYEPVYGSAASGLVNIEITLTNGYSIESNKVNINGQIIDTNKLYIRNGTRLINNVTGLPYTIILPTDYAVIDLTKPLMTTQLKVVQGVKKTSYYTAKGKLLETIHITTNGLYDKDYIEVLVDGKLFTPVTCLYDMSENSEEYVITTGYNNELDIMFGNGVHGKYLTEGQSVVIRFIGHDGLLGNISLKSTPEFSFADQLYDADGNAVKNINFLNITMGSSISGAADADKVSDIKSMIGYNSRSLVLANDKNFKLFLNRFSFVGQSNIWCDNNSLVVNIACLSNFKNLVKTPDEFFEVCNTSALLLDSYQKQMILDTLNNSNKTFAGVTIKFIDPIVYKYSVMLYIKCEPKYDKELVKSEIDNIIYNYFVNLPNNTSFVSKSSLIKLILDKLPYIESLDLYFISDINETAKQTGTYEKYVKTNVNGNWVYQKQKLIYDKAVPLGLDGYGNIEIQDLFEIPVISNNVKYISSDGNSITLPAVQCLFIK